MRLQFEKLFYKHQSKTAIETVETMAVTSASTVLDSEMLRSPSFIEKLETFRNIPNPPLVLRGSRIPVWYEDKLNGFYKFGADSEINGDDVDTAIHRLVGLIPRNEKIYILTGTHGDEFGTNWIENISYDGMRIFERDNKCLEHDFMFEDASTLYNDIKNDNIEVIDISHPQFKFEDYVKYIVGDYHVIMAYCFGRNDKAFRAFLDLPPVTSYVYEL